MGISQVMSPVLLLYYQALLCIACDFKFTRKPLHGHFCTTTSNNTEITFWQTDRPHCMSNCVWMKTCRYMNHNYDTGQCILGFDQCETLVPVVHGTVNVFGPPRDNCLSWGPKNEPGRYPVNEPILAGRAWIGDALVVGKVDPVPAQVGTYWGVTEGRQVGISGTEVEYLTMNPVCTMSWIPFVAGEELPAVVVKGGHLSDGSVTYVCRVNHYGTLIIGYYDDGTKLAYYANRGTQMTITVEILVLL